MEQYKPLKGVKVVELSLMVASASCGRMTVSYTHLTLPTISRV